MGGRIGLGHGTIHIHDVACLVLSYTCTMKQAVKAPKELVLAVLARLKDCGVEILVAPYEADAQVTCRVLLLLLFCSARGSR